MNTADKCLEILKNNGINSASIIEFDVNGEMMQLTLAYIIDVYMQASQEAQLVFLRALEKSSSSEDEIQRFFEGMGKLLLMTQLSEKFNFEE